MGWKSVSPEIDDDPYEGMPAEEIFRQVWIRLQNSGYKLGALGFRDEERANELLAKAFWRIVENDQG